MADQCESTEIFEGNGPDGAQHVVRCVFESGHTIKHAARDPRDDQRFVEWSRDPDELPKPCEDCGDHGIGCRNCGHGPNDAIFLAEIADLKRQLAEARGWVKRMQNEHRVLTCAFCGEAYPPGTPASNDAALLAHVRVCAKHPMREAEDATHKVRTECEDIAECILSLRRGWELCERAQEQFYEQEERLRALARGEVPS